MNRFVSALNIARLYMSLFHPPFDARALLSLSTNSMSMSFCLMPGSSPCISYDCALSSDVEFGREGADVMVSVLTVVITMIRPRRVSG